MIQIIDYGAGNILSVENALKQLGLKSEVISTPGEIKKSAKIIFPGVGAAKSAMTALQKSGFPETISRIKNPFLGICLGLQLLMDFSEEGNVDCLGIIPGKVEKFPQSVRIPQIGWNKVIFEKDPLFTGIKNENYFYFVNSFYANADKKYVLGVTNYGITFPSIVRKNNFYGVQFHPEKSGETGLKLLNNFCKLC